jgi:hypothetical protein
MSRRSSLKYRVCGQKSSFLIQAGETLSEQKKLKGTRQLGEALGWPPVKDFK